MTKSSQKQLFQLVADYAWQHPKRDEIFGEWTRLELEANLFRAQISGKLFVSRIDGRISGFCTSTFYKDRTHICDLLCDSVRDMHLLILQSPNKNPITGLRKDRLEVKHDFEKLCLKLKQLHFRDSARMITGLCIQASR